MAGARACSAPRITAASTNHRRTCAADWKGRTTAPSCKTSHRHCGVDGVQEVLGQGVGRVQLPEGADRGAMHHDLGLHRAREDDRQQLHDHPGRSEPEGPKELAEEVHPLCVFEGMREIMSMYGTCTTDRVSSFTFER